MRLTSREKAEREAGETLWGLPRQQPSVDRRRRSGVVDLQI